MLEVVSLSCTRGDRMLFREVSFKLGARGLLHIAGANGSGKTSLLRIVCGLGAADDGQVRWRGVPIREVRETYGREVVYFGHAHALKDDLTAAENLLIACEIAGRPAPDDAIQQALAQFGVAHCARLPACALSQGQKRRSALARLALSREAALWILDEPFSALDVAAVAQLENFILDYVDNGGSVMFTTHQEGAIAARVTQKLDLDTLQVRDC